MFAEQSVGRFSEPGLVPEFEADSKTDLLCVVEESGEPLVIGLHIRWQLKEDHAEPARLANRSNRIVNLSIARCSFSIEGYA